LTGDAADQHETILQQNVTFLRKRAEFDAFMRAEDRKRERTYPSNRIRYVEKIEARSFVRSDLFNKSKEVLLDPRDIEVR